VFAALSADAVYAWFAGADSIRFVKAYKDYGLAGKLPLLAYNTLVDDVLLPALGDTALGIVSIGHYSATSTRREPGLRAGVRASTTPGHATSSSIRVRSAHRAAIEARKARPRSAAFRDAIRDAATKIHPARRSASTDTSRSSRTSS